MSAYWPESLLSAWAIAGLLGLILIGGFVLQQRTLLWLQVALSFGLAHVLCLQEPGGFRMLAICGVVLYAMKGVVRFESQQRTGTQLNARQWLGFCLFWPGMNPTLFYVWQPQRPEFERGDLNLLKHGLFCLLSGVLLLLLAYWLWPLTHSYFLISLLLLPGLSLCLHFGLFDLLAFAWQIQGVECEALFQSPLRSQSLREFWGQRWNLAFSEMTRLAIYAPLNLRFSAGSAAFWAFAFSGLLHELAISFSVQAGYGLPSLYFLLHGSLMIAERQLYRTGRPIDTHAIWGRLWTLIWLVLPLPFLFHKPFLSAVIWPLVGAT